MDRGIEDRDERRLRVRWPPERTPWNRSAVLRPGRQVQLINVSAGGVLITSFCRLRPGARAELQLTGTYPLVVAGRIDRCRVVSLEPLNYEGAIVFERVLEWLQ